MCMNYPSFLPEYVKTDWRNKANIKDPSIALVQYFLFYNYTIGMHMHDYYEINLIMDGQGAHYFSDYIFEVSKGDLFIIPPAVKHGYFSCENLKVCHIIIHSNFIHRYEDDLKKLPGFIPLFFIEPHLREHAGLSLMLKLYEDEFHDITALTERIGMIYNNHSGMAFDSVSINAMTLFLISQITAYYFSMLKNPERKAWDNMTNMQFMQIVEQIYNNYDSKINIGDLAAEMHLSRSAYYSLFRKLIGKTPGEIIIDLRIKKAMTLLETTTYSITYIAQQTGFFDASHFIRTFQNCIGMSPTKYRSRHRQKSIY